MAGTFLRALQEEGKGQREALSDAHGRLMGEAADRWSNKDWPEEEVGFAVASAAKMMCREMQEVLGVIESAGYYIGRLEAASKGDRHA